MDETLSVSPTITIRPAIAADLPALGVFGARLVELHHALDPERFLEATLGTPAGYARFLENKLADEDSILLVAEDRRSILGYVYAAIEGYDYMALRGPAGVVHDLFVEQSSRREGVGRMLLDAALEAIFDRGEKRIVLSTAHRNEAAKHLFASLGFRPTMVEMTRNR